MKFNQKISQDKVKYLTSAAYSGMMLSIDVDSISSPAFILTVE